MKYFLDKYFEKTKGAYPFFKYCPKVYWDYYWEKKKIDTLGYSYDEKNPTFLNAKIRWLLYNENLYLKTLITDKSLFKNYIKNKIGDGYTTKTISVYNNFKEINFKELPEHFVIKATHGWKMAYFVNNKEWIIKRQKFFNKLFSRWLKINHFYNSLEPQYRNIKPRLLIEELRDDFVGSYRKDIEVHCFNGEPKFIYKNIDSCYLYDLNLNETKYKFKRPFRIWANLNKKNMDFSLEKDGFTQEEINKLGEMIEISKELSKDFSYVRMDFVLNKNKVNIGEMTFSPSAGLIPFESKETDEELGSMLILPEVHK